MPKAKKLPSGSWRCRVYSYTDTDGKKHQESFTAPTKAQAEMLAAEYAANKHRRARHDITVGEAIDGYISAKEPVLSPSTIRGYDRMRKVDFGSITKKKVRSLTSEDLQLFVSDLARNKSPKSVRNAYGLLTASIALYAPDLTFRVTLPAKPKKRPESPSDDAVRALYNAAYPRLRLCIGLGMMGLREGEICALDYSDLHGKTLHVHKDMVRDRHGKWIIKETPKTSDSDRYIDLPPFIVELIGSGEGLIVSISPNGVAKAFIKLRNKLGLSDIRFHDLRHFFASVGALIMPDIYLADLGGWCRAGNAPVMKSVYQNNIKSMSEYYNKKIADYMENIVKEDA